MSSLQILENAINAVPGLRRALQVQDAILNAPVVWLTGCVYKGDKYKQGEAKPGASLLAGLYATAPASEQGLLDIGQAATTLISTAEQVELLEMITSQATAGTLFRILGKPAAIEIRPRKLEKSADETGVAACYYKTNDTIALLTSKEPVCAAELAGAFWHEMGHVWQTRHGDAIGEIWDKYKIKPPADEGANYALHSRFEHQAEATAGAIGILWILNREDASDFSVQMAIERMDKAAPGSLLLARVILGYPNLEHSSIKSRRIEGVDLTPVELPGGWEHKDEDSFKNRQRMFATAALGGALGRLLRKNKGSRKR